MREQTAATFRQVTCPHHLQGIEFMREMQQYIASATLIDPCEFFQNATRLVPNATEPTLCCRFMDSIKQ